MDSNKTKILWRYKILLLAGIFLANCAPSKAVAASAADSGINSAADSGTKKADKASGQARSGVPSLFIPPLLDASAGKVVLQAQRGKSEFRPGVASPTMGYNGSLLGPTVLLRRGQKAQVEVHNQLGESTTLHSHGAIVPGAADGGPHKLIAAGQSWLLQFVVRQQAATLWYHPHRVGSTAEQVWQGMAGMYIVRDENSDSLPIPQDYGYNDIPIIVQERQLDRAGRLVSYRRASGHMATMNGVRGNSLLVNGQLQPQLRAPVGWLRLRLLNGSNASSYRFRFRSAQEPVAFYWIATEQGLLPRPQQRQYLDLATGSRSEIMIRIPQDAPAAGLKLQLSEWNRQLTTVSSSRYDILTIVPDPERRSAAKLPEVLREDSAWDEEEARTLALAQDPAALQQLAVRDFRLEMMGGGMMSMMSGYSINGQSYRMGQAAFHIQRNHYEVWRFRSDTLGHPVHIHGVQFRLLRTVWYPQNPGGSPGTAGGNLERQSGWRDTFTLNTNGDALVLVRFTAAADAANPYMLHCHMLEHEEAGMMSQFTVS